MQILPATLRRRALEHCVDTHNARELWFLFYFILFSILKLFSRVTEDLSL